MVKRAADSLELQPASASRLNWPKYRAPLAVSALVALLASAFSVGVTAWLYERFDVPALQASSISRSGETHPPEAAAGVADISLPAERASRVSRDLPAQAMLTILAGSFPRSQAFESEIRAMTDWLEAEGYHVYYADVDHGVNGHWQRVLAGAYTDLDAAAADAARLRAAAPELEARVVTASAAMGISR
jgi:hypothetical protein